MDIRIEQKVSDIYQTYIPLNPAYLNTSEYK